MRSIIVLCALVFGVAAQAEIQKSTTVVNGEVFHFTVTSEKVDCNGTGFTGVELEKLSHDKKAKVKVYKVTPQFGPVTVMGCMKAYDHKVLVEKSGAFKSKDDETVVFLLDESTDLVLGE